MPCVICNMIALALLFIVIMALLLVMVRLLQKYFESYNESIIACKQRSETKKCIELTKINRPSDSLTDEINTVLNDRLTEMERKFPVPSVRDEAPERITTVFKQVLLSSLNLLKIVERDRER